MTIKQKFERIDQSKLEPNQVNALKIVLDFTENFKTKDAEKIKVTNDKLDNIIEKLQAKNPDALKPLKSVTAKTTKKASQTNKPKRTILGLAKEIRKTGESFDEAKSRASKIISEEKAETNKVVKSEMKSLLEYIKKHKELEGIVGTDLGRDAGRVAKRGGVRTVTHSGFTTNKYGTFENKLGRKYSENRENRKDRLAPNYPKDAPLLEKGGNVNPKKWINYDKDHLIDTESGMIVLRGTDLENIKPKDVKGFETLAKGGMLSPKERYNLEIKGLTGVSVSAIEKYIEENKLNDNDVLNIVVGLGRKQLKGADVSTAMVGKKGNAESKKLIEFVKDNKAMKMELGGNVGAYDLAGHLDGTFNVGQNIGDLSGTTGTHYTGLVGETGAMSAGEMFADGGYLTDPNFGQFQAGVYAKGGGLANHGLKEGDEILKTLSGGIQKVKDKKGKIVYVNLANGERSNDIPLPFALGGTVPSGLDGALQSYTNAYANEGATAGMSYADGGYLTDPTFGQFQSQVFAKGGKTRSRKEYLEELGNKEADIWDKIGANSGAEIRGNKSLLKKYAENLEKVMRKNDIGRGSFDQEDYDFFTDKNWHLLNDFLVWNNYYEPNMTIKEKKWREKAFKEKNIYVSDPEIITVNEVSSNSKNGYVQVTKTASKEYVVSVETDAGDWKQFNDTWGLNELEKAEKFAKRIAENHKVKYIGVDTTPYDFVHGKSKKYVPHYDIESITVKKGGKEVTYKGSDVLNGANMLKSGGDLSKSATYFPKRSIVVVTLKNGEKIHPANGYWVGKKTPKMSRTQFEDESYEYEGGGMTNKDGIKVQSKYEPKENLSEAEWMAKHNDSREARSYAGGGEIKVSELNNGYAYRFSKNDDNRGSLYKEHGLYVVNGFEDGNHFSEIFEKLSEAKEYYLNKKNKMFVGGLFSKKSEEPKKPKVKNFEGKQVFTSDGHLVTVLSQYSDTALVKDVGNLEKDSYTIDLKKIQTEENLAMMNGGVTFEEKSKAIAKKFEGKKVEPKYQKEYGKTYDKAESKEVGNKIAGAMRAKNKMAKGAIVKKGSGNPILKQINENAKRIRKEGESWSSALKRAWDATK